MTETSTEVGPFETLLRIDHLSKDFRGAMALDDVSLDIRAGEVHGLVGQNGSGKSTLIKCLSGFHAPDSRWTLRVGDRVINRALHPGETAELGISFVHQDLGVLPDLTVLENLMLGQIARDHRPYISWRQERKKATALFKAFGLDIDPRMKLSAFRPVEQAQVAIIRAVLQLREARHLGGTGVLVLDEATTFLDRDGRKSLHQLLRSIVSAGAGVLFVSHDVDEVLDLTDRVTVLRDGRLVDTVSSADVTPDDVVRMIVAGRSSATPSPSPSTGSDGEADSDHTRRSLSEPTGPLPIGRLDVTDLNGDFVSDIELHARGGEIVGVTGIVGSGWEFVLEHMYGARPSDGGIMSIDGADIDLTGMTTARAVGLGMIFVPSDRLRQSIVADLNVKENVMLPVLGQLYTRGVLHLGVMTKRCKRLLTDNAVQPANPQLLIGSLSGGNQQKAVLGKWLQLEPRILLLNEPTQGVDVGARQGIFATIRAEAARGALVLYASGNWEEVHRISDRVIVIADGRVTAELSGDELTLDRIAQEAYRGTRRSADLAVASQAWEKVGK